MSQDRKFMDIFLLVLGVLFMISIGVFVLSREISEKKFGEILSADTAYQEAVLDQIRPVGSVLLPGQESAAEAAPAETKPVAAALSGPQVYNQACLACHGAGIGGAPVFGDAGAWASRISKGMDVLNDHGLNGYQGDAGYMPPKGGRTDLSDAEILDAIEYMVTESQ